MIINPRTHSDYVHVGSTAKRHRTPNGPVFTTRAYYVHKDDFARMLAGQPTQRYCYRSDNDGRPRGFVSHRCKAHAAMMEAFRATQRAHTLGARAMESDWSL